MKRHKLLNIRNERLLNKLFENQGLKYESAKPWEQGATDEETIKWIRETFGRDTHRDIDKSAWRIDTSFFAYLDKLITDKKAAKGGDVPPDERHQGYVWKRLHNVSLEKLLAIQPVLKAEYGSDKGDLGGFRAGTEPPPESAHVFREEEKEDESSEELNLLKQISNKLDTLEDLDTSIDYLASVLSGEDTLSVGMRQRFFGRGAQAEPVKLKKEIREFIEGKLEEDAEPTYAEAVALANRVIDLWKSHDGIDKWVFNDINLIIIAKNKGELTLPDGVSPTSFKTLQKFSVDQLEGIKGMLEDSEDESKANRLVRR